MSDDGPKRPGKTETAVSALQAWVGDFLAESDNPLHHPLAFFRDNRPVEPEELPAPSEGKVAVLVHGLGGHEGQWAYPSPSDCGGYGARLAEDRGYLPLYVRYNSGLRISTNGAALHGLLSRYAARHEVEEFIGIGHSMGGLVLRSASHIGRTSDWLSQTRRMFYLGSPHAGAPLEKFAHVTTHLLGKLDVTAARVIRDLINTRSAGVKDLRYGNLIDEDWLDVDPDALLENRRVPLPWPAHVRHHRIVGHAIPKLSVLGDGMVLEGSARAADAPGPDEVTVLPGIPHLTLIHHPRVYDEIERFLDG